MYSREQSTKRGIFEGHGKRRHEQWSRQARKPMTSKLYWGLVPENQQDGASLSSSTTLDPFKVK